MALNIALFTVLLFIYVLIVFQLEGLLFQSINYNIRRNILNDMTFPVISSLPLLYGSYLHTRDMIPSRFKEAIRVKAYKVIKIFCKEERELEQSLPHRLQSETQEYAPLISRQIS